MKPRTADNLDRRLRVVERAASPSTTFGGGELMEVETVPASRNVTMVATHSDDDANKTWVVPLRLPRATRAYRASFVAKTTDTDDDTKVAFAIYRAVPPALDKGNPVAASFQLELYRTLGIQGLTDTDAKRYSITPTKELFLDPRVGYYFLGFQASGAKAKLLCPEFGFAKGTMRSAWKTASTGSATGAFAQTITTQPASTYVPYVVLRSFAGVRMLGHGTEDA